MDNIDIFIFDKPSGTVRGSAVAFFGDGKKRKRIAHAHIIVGAEPEITLSAPSKMSIADVSAYADTLKAFCDTLEKSLES